MATIYKRTRKAPVPPGSEIVTRKGQLFAVWNRGKRQRRAPLTADGKAVLLESPGYCIEYFDHNGQRKKKSTRCTDRDAVVRLAAELEKNAMLRRDGLVDPIQERFACEGRRPLTEHLADYERFLADKGDSEKHISETMRSIRRVLVLCGANVAADLAGPAVMKVIGQLRESGSSPRTCNAYLTAVKGLTRWLWRHKRTVDDSLCTLAHHNEEADRRHVRRELDAEEIGRILATVERRTEPFHNLAGPDRAMVYRLALGTGFRANELRSLTPESFELNSPTPVVIVAAAYSKHRREDRQPIHRDLANVLRSWLADKPAGQPVFGRLPNGTARMLRGDLAAARRAWLDDAPTEGARKAREKTDFLKYQNSAGEVADFHSTRHTYISGIVAGGASVKTAQELARHSDPKLTIGRYSHARHKDLVSALDSLPGNKPAVQRAAAQPEEAPSPANPMEGQTETQTDNPHQRMWAQKWAHSDGEGWQNMAKNTPREDARTPQERSKEKETGDSLQVESPARFRQSLATAGEERRARDSNPQPVARHLISSQAANRSRTLHWGDTRCSQDGGLRRIPRKTHRLEGRNQSDHSDIVFDGMDCSFPARCWRPL